jgi:hypothetical protein
MGCGPAITAIASAVTIMCSRSRKRGAIHREIQHFFGEFHHLIHLLL